MISYINIKLKCVDHFSRRNNRLAHLAWENAQSKKHTNLLKNGITLKDEVQLICLSNAVWGQKRQVLTSLALIIGFSAMQFCWERNKNKLSKAKVHLNSKKKNSFRCRTWVKIHNCSQSCRIGEDICHQNDSICDNWHHRLQLGPFLKAFLEEHYIKCRRYRQWTSGHTSSLVLTAWSHGASTRPNFPRSCCKKSTSL